MEQTLMDALLPLLNGTDKKKIKDAMVTHVAANIGNFIILDDVALSDTINSHVVKVALEQVIVESMQTKQFKDDIATSVFGYVDNEIDRMYDDDELLDSEKVGKIVTDVVTSTLKERFKK